LEKDNFVIFRHDYSQRTLRPATRSITGAFYSTHFLHDCILLDENPMDSLKKRFSDFSPSQSDITIAAEPKAIPGIIKNLNLNLARDQPKLDGIFKDAKIKAKEDKNISKLLEERMELSQKLNKLLSIIEKYIEKHHPIEEI
jgi:hypothetical protein